MKTVLFFLWSIWMLGGLSACRSTQQQIKVVVAYVTDSVEQLICTYEDSRSIEAKCRYILQRDLRGAMYWEYASDDEKGTFRQTLFNKMMKKKEK